MVKRLKSVKSATLLKQLQSVYHAYLIWQPGKATPVSVLFLNVNGVLVTHDKLLVNSPGVFNLPDPDTNNQFKFTWAFFVGELCAIAFARHCESPMQLARHPE